MIENESNWYVNKKLRDSRKKIAEDVTIRFQRSPLSDQAPNAEDIAIIRSELAEAKQRLSKLYEKIGGPRFTERRRRIFAATYGPTPESDVIEAVSHEEVSKQVGGTPRNIGSILRSGWVNLGYWGPIKNNPIIEERVRIKRLTELLEESESAAR